MKEYLLTAGPTPVPERVLLAMARPMLYHRAPAFTECLREVQEGLKWLMQTKQLPLMLSGLGHDRAWTLRSATSCAPATRRSSSAAASSASAGGTFARPTASSCVFIDVEWGKSVEPKAVAEAIEKNPGVRAVYATACETSTATKHDIEAIAKVVRATTTSSCASTPSPRSASTTSRSTSGASTWCAWARRRRSCCRRGWRWWRSPTRPGRPTSAPTCRASTWTWRASGRARKRARPPSRRPSRWSSDCASRCAC